MALISATTASPCRVSKSAITTAAPSFANRRASASPIPCAPPVTMATLSLSRIACSLGPCSTASLTSLVDRLSLFIKRQNAFPPVLGRDHPVICLDLEHHPALQICTQPNVDRLLDLPCRDRCVFTDDRGCF